MLAHQIPETEDEATESLLLKTQSRSRGMSTIHLAGSVPGQKVVAIYTCRRYGPDWAQWRKINDWTPKDGNEPTLDLGLDGNLKITSVTRNSNNTKGTTWMLIAQLWE